MNTPISHAPKSQHYYLIDIMNYFPEFSFTLGKPLEPLREFLSTSLIIGHLKVEIAVFNASSNVGTYFLE